MPLKFKIKKSESASIPAEFKNHYIERGEELFLDVEDVVSLDVHRDIRDNNLELQRMLGVKSHTDAKTKLEKIKDFDPDAITAQTTELENFRAGKAPKLEEMVTTRTDAMRKDFEKKNKDLADSNVTLSNKLAKVLIDDALATAAAAKGVIPSALQDVKLRGRAVFKLEGEEAIAYGPDNRPLYGKDGQPMKMAEWMDKLAGEAAHLFNPNKGGGGGGGGSGATGYTFGNPWSKKHHNLTNQATVIRENPQLAERLKQQAQDE